MKALIYEGPKKISLEEIPMPVAEGTDVVVKVARAGICGSDITAYLYDGHRVGIFPKGEMGVDGQFGHEMVGTVYQVGQDVTDIQVGERVFVNPTTCKRNGMLGCDMAGAFSEYVLVEDAKYGNNLLKLEDEVSFDEAIVVEPLAVGTHGKNCVNVKAHEHVVVYGAGTIGLCTLNALIASGVRNPVVVDVNQERLKLVKEMGGVPFHPEQDGDLKEFLTAHFGSLLNMFMEPCVDVDVYIDCAGAPSILEQVIGMAKGGARISIVAVYKKPITFDLAPFAAPRLTLQGSTGYDVPDIVEALNNVTGHRTKAPEIVTHHFPHSQAVEAFETACNPATGAIKVVIDYEA